MLLEFLNRQVNNKTNCQICNKFQSNLIELQFSNKYDIIAHKFLYVCIECNLKINKYILELTIENIHQNYVEDEKKHELELLKILSQLKKDIAKMEANKEDTTNLEEMSDEITNKLEYITKKNQYN